MISSARTTSDSTPHNGLSLKANDLFLVLENGRLSSSSEQDNVYGEKALIKFLSLSSSSSSQCFAIIDDENRNISSCIDVFAWPLREPRLSSLVRAQKMFFVSLTTHKTQSPSMLLGWMCLARIYERTRERPRKRERARKANGAHIRKLHRSTTSE